MPRIVVVLKRVEGGYQAQLREAAGGNHLFYSRRDSKSSNARKVAEQMFGTLAWQDPPERLTQSEPGVLRVAYLNL
jgi:hypothetical protein